MQTWQQVGNKKTSPHQSASPTASPRGEAFFALFGELFGNGQLFVLLGVWVKGGEGLRIEIRIWSASGGSFGEWHSDG